MLPAIAGAQSSNPSTLPRVPSDGLQYLGAFRLPATESNGDSFSIGGRQMTFNPAGHSLIVGSRAGRVAEVSIPTPVRSADVNALPFATYLQGFSDPTEGRLSQISSDGVAIDGLLVHNNRLYGTASIYYDALNTQRVSHYSHSLQLNQSSFVGWSSVWDATKTGYVSGAMAVVPAEWQALLGGPAITSQCCIPIVTRTSWGPSAFAFDPSRIGQAGTIAAQPLLYYTGDHTTLGHWDGSNPVYGATTNMGGMAIIAGTRTILYFGRNGTGPHCYGNGTNDPSLDGRIGPDGAKWCYDPTASGKGSHAYPYRYQIWAYDLNDFAAVKNGTKQPWELEPYGVWPISFPIDEPTVLSGGVGYDSANQVLYLSQLLADRDGYSYRPVVHAFKISNVPGAVAPSSVTLDADKAAPQAANTAVTFSATPSGGVAPHSFKWSVHDGSSWSSATAWSSTSKFTWTPRDPNLSYRVMVSVKNAGSTSETPDASAAMPFAISSDGNSRSGAGISSITIVANRVAPQMIMTPVTFTASAAGGVMPYEFKWVLYDGGGWTALTSGSALNTFTWTPGTANPNYRVGVWARSAGNSKDEPESSASNEFAITAPAPVRVTAVSVAANRPSPQPAGSSITWSATATGGRAPLQYKWVVYDGSPSWIPVTGWTSSNTFTWTPASANPNYRVGVWVRGSDNAADEPEASASQEFVIAGPTSGAPISGVSISANKVAPQAAGATVVVSAAVSGGAGSYQFKWLVYDGGTWNAVSGWSSSNTFSWTPSRPDPNYIIGVWVKSAANPRDELEVSATLPFAIK
jgi:hypothetical protein